MYFRLVYTYTNLKEASDPQRLDTHSSHRFFLPPKLYSQKYCDIFYTFISGCVAIRDHTWISFLKASMSNTLCNRETVAVNASQQENMT
jgi:hypothetical protein